MNSLFFEKGSSFELQPTKQTFFETSNNLDSKKYVIEKIPIEEFQKDQNYISNRYFLERGQSLIAYFSCWKESEEVVVEEKPMIREKKKQKTKMLDLIRRKPKNELESPTPHSKLNSQKQQKSASNQQQQQPIKASQKKFLILEFIYVQLEYMSEIQLPNSFPAMKDLMTVIYLLGQRVQQRTGFFPCLIPMRNEDSDKIKFVRKGQSVNVELYRLMKYLFGSKEGISIGEWSESVKKAVQIAQINMDSNLVGEVLKNAIQEYIGGAHQIGLLREGQKDCKLETIKIQDSSRFKLVNSGIEIDINEYKVEYLLKSEVQRELILTHNIFEEYKLQGEKSNFIVRWLYQLAT